VSTDAEIAVEVTPAIKILRGTRSCHNGRWDWTEYLPRHREDNIWEPGAWTPERVVAPCETAWHACCEDVLLGWLAEGGTEAWRCEVEGAIEHRHAHYPAKLCGSRLRLVRPVEREVLQRMWEECRDARVLLRVLACQIRKRGDAAHRALVLATGACARTALEYVPAGEDRPRLAIETAERWARGEATLDEVRRAKSDTNAAWKVAWAAQTAQAAQAARAAQAAQAVAWAAQASQASQASLVANAVVHTVKATTNDESGRTTALAKMADLVRAIVPICPVNATLEGSR
jgi:hypothetical protein